MKGKELELKNKNELKKNSENMRPEKVFSPEVDIFEKEDALLIQANMPGVKKDSVEVNLKENVLSIKGRIDCQSYEGLNPIYGEYNIGDYERTFELSNQIQQDKIEATMNDGVLSLILPKAEYAKPRTIHIN